MARKEISGHDGGFNELICQEDFNDEEQPSKQDRQQVVTSYVTPSKHCRLAAVSLTVLAAILLLVDIGLGIHYNTLSDAYLTLEDAEFISHELTTLRADYKTAMETMSHAEKKLKLEQSRQTTTNWEFEHQTKRTNDYKELIEKTNKDIAMLTSHLPKIHDGCKYCPTGWVLMNSVCYYYPFAVSDGFKSWQKAREHCQMYGGDLLVIDSMEKENMTVHHLRSNPEVVDEMIGFWFGLRDVHEEATWKWLDGTVLIEGFWREGEPNDIHDEDCAAVFPRENFFMAWNDVRCKATMKWICEKAPVLQR